MTEEWWIAFAFDWARWSGGGIRFPTDMFLAEYDPVPGLASTRAGAGAGAAADGGGARRRLLDEADPGGVAEAAAAYTSGLGGLDWVNLVRRTLVRSRV